ncbi:hypothetical protein AMECASPLE_039628, partial [Ameca splendens]
LVAFLLSTSPEPTHKRTLSTLQRKPPHIKLIPLLQAHTEQHQVNSPRLFLPKTWILNLIPPGNLTTITHEILVSFCSCLWFFNKMVFILLSSPECSLYVGQSYFEYNDIGSGLHRAAVIKLPKLELSETQRVIKPLGGNQWKNTNSEDNGTLSIPP